MHPQTANNWVREGRMPMPFRGLSTGLLLVDVLASAGAEWVVL